MQQGGHVLRALLRQNAHTGGQNIKLLLRQPRFAGQGVFHDPVNRGGRQCAGAAVVDRGGHRVNVRPRADAGVLPVLLDGAEALFGDHLGGLNRAVLSLNIQILCRAQVQKDGLAVRLHHDIVRADVPVNDTVLVDFCQRPHDGRHEPDAAVKVHGAVLLHFLLQRLALDKVHDDVGGLILCEDRFHPDDVGNPAQLCHFPGFLQKAVEAPLGAGFPHHGAAPHHGGAVFPADHAGACGEIFLDGDLLLQQQIKSDIGDAEAALPQHFAHQILSVQDRTGLQRERLRVHAAVSAPAFRTVGDPSRQVVHTFHTSAYFHSPFLFLSGELVGFPPFFGTITVK